MSSEAPKHTQFAAPGFTPGPWASRLAFNKGEPWEYVIHSGAQLIGSTIDCNDTSEANARLIAAAPDLLAALKQYVFATTEDAPTPTPEDSPALIWARAAIAKAEGRTT